MAMFKQAIFLLALAGCTVEIKYPATASEAEPPARFVHPYTGDLHIQEVPVEEARAACLAMATRLDPTKEYRLPSGLTKGCSVQLETSCHVVIATGDERDRILRHEIAHCNGWEKWHPK